MQKLYNQRACAQLWQNKEVCLGISNEHFSEPSCEQVPQERQQTKSKLHLEVCQQLSYPNYKELPLLRRSFQINT
jgi:hypothetical protein